MRKRNYAYATPNIIIGATQVRLVLISKWTNLGDHDVAIGMLV
jgi:hypothetical protein